MIPIRIRSKTSGSFLSILYPQHRKYLSMRTAFLGRIHILLFALSLFFGPKCPPALWLNLLCGLQRRELHKISHSDLNVEYFTHILPQSSRNFSLPYNPVVTTIYIEEEGFIQKRRQRSSLQFGGQNLFNYSTPLIVTTH